MNVFDTFLCSVESFQLRFHQCALSGICRAGDTILQLVALRFELEELVTKDRTWQHDEMRCALVVPVRSKDKAKKNGRIGFGGRDSCNRLFACASKVDISHEEGTAISEAGARFPPTRSIYVAEFLIRTQARRGKLFTKQVGS